MRKAFQVATVFTGAAACAAAFTPTAMAATATPTKTQQINAPDIVKKNCGGGSVTRSMVFVWANQAAHGPTCVGGSPGGPGTVSLSGNSFGGFCTGNNYGWLIENGTRRDFHQFSSAHSVHWKVGQVHISGWSGRSACTL